jgi:hypothetical protein
MDIKTVLSIVEAGTTVATFAPLAIGTAMKIKQALEAGSDLKVSIEQIAAQTVENNQETLRLIHQWKRDNQIP